MATLYQKVKKALSEVGPTTFPILADHLGADEDAVRLALYELRKRGKARIEQRRAHEESEFWIAVGLGR
jgi:predicted ArsR family transcriptional regulator